MLEAMKVLLHACCSTCLLGPYRELVSEGHEVHVLFYNPNVHPLIEFRRRLKSVRILQERMGFPLVFVEQYGLREYLERVDWRAESRCEDCYRLRLSRTASEARERGFDAVST